MEIKYFRCNKSCKSTTPCILQFESIGTEKPDRCIYKDVDNCEWEQINIFNELNK